jgi:regulator of protease activity HflC (stomatin/prohibitin superfamily)
MRRLLFALLVLSAIGASLIWLGEHGWGPVVITHEDEQKIVLFLGNPISIRTTPGISLRPPFAEVRVLDRRYQYLNSEPQQMQTRDAERPVIDHYVVWRIADPLRFFADFPRACSRPRPRWTGSRGPTCGTSSASARCRSWWPTPATRS